MYPSKYTPEQRLQMVKKWNAGEITINQIIKQGIKRDTFYSWVKHAKAKGLILDADFRPTRGKRNGHDPVTNGTTPHVKPAPNPEGIAHLQRQLLKAHILLGQVTAKNAELEAKLYNKRYRDQVLLDDTLDPREFEKELEK